MTALFMNVRRFLERLDGPRVRTLRAQVWGVV